MKYIWSVLVLTGVMSVGHAQQPGSPSAKTNHVSSDDFRAQVQKELSPYKNSEWLYRRCDVFSRKIDLVAARVLGLSGSNAETILDNASDSIESDIGSTIADDDEPSIAINRRNPNIIVAGANDLVISADTVSGGMTSLSMPAFLSTDAGSTWKTYRLPIIDDSGAVPFGDPMIVSDNAGIFYYAFLLDSIDVDGTSDLMVAHSSDGKNWTLGNTVMGNPATQPDSSLVLEDKETIAVDNDPQSPYYKRLYLAWTEYDYNLSDYSTIDTYYLAYSDDTGMNWSTPIPYTFIYGGFPLLRVGKQGTVFIASMGYDTSGGGVTGMTISTDGGQTFSESSIAYFTDFPIDNQGRDGLKGDNGFRATPYPCFDLDRNNTIYAVYGTYDEGNGDAALFEVTSTDLGQTWSDSVQIGTPTGLTFDHYMPWVSIDPITQQAYISLSSSEEDIPLNVKSRSVRCSYQNPTHLEDISPRLFNTLDVTYSGRDFIGDYAECDAYNGYYAASWTENRPQNHTDGDIFAYVSSPANDGVAVQINSNEFAVSNPSPNPAAGGEITFTIASSVQLPASIHIFDLRGNEVLTTQSMMDPGVQNMVSLDVHTLRAGVYLARIECGGQSVRKNFVVLR